MGTLCANSYRVLFSSLQHYQVVDVSLPSKTDFVKWFLQKISSKVTLNVICFNKTGGIIGAGRSSQFASDSDAGFRRDRFMIVLRPCATRHKFRLYTGFTAVRLLGVPYEIAQSLFEPLGPTGPKFDERRTTYDERIISTISTLGCEIHGCPGYAPSI